MSLFQKQAKSGKVDYGAVSRDESTEDEDASTIDECSTLIAPDFNSRTASAKSYSFLWLIAAGAIMTAMCLIALVGVVPASPELASANLAMSGAAASSPVSSVSHHDDTTLAHDLEEYAWIHNVDQRKYYFHDTDKWPEVSLDLEREQERDNGVSHEETVLTISWTNGKRGGDDSKRSILHDDDVVALQCGTSLGHLRIVEAVSLSHVREAHHSSQRRRLVETTTSTASTTATSTSVVRRVREWFDRRSSFGDWNVNKHEWARERSFEKEWNEIDGNEWILDPVPEEIAVEPYCQAILCHMIEEDEYVVVAESALIRFGHIHG